MLVNDVLDIRDDLLQASQDDDGFVQQSLVLDEVMPLLLETKAVDSEDINHSYYCSPDNKLKINGYSVSSTGERLQLFIVDEKGLNPTLEGEAFTTHRSDYETYFKRVSKFVSSAIQGKLGDIQESDPVRPLLSKLSSRDGMEQFDVVEVFLITMNATVSLRGADVALRDIHFKDDSLNFRMNFNNGEQFNKELLLVRKVIDLNYLGKVLAAKGRVEPLNVRFKDVVGKYIEVIKAADEEDFESYLCVLDAELLAGLYKRYGGRLLEKNVRSFLQFKGVNRGLKQTIREEPEKFIAYNNGLTITSTSAKTSFHKKILHLEELEDLQIVNGGQTTASIYFSHKEGLDISKVKIMAKINVAKNSKARELEDLISKISEFSNSQSKVSKVDLRSRSPALIKIKALSENVVTPSGKRWFFERARGDFDTQARKSSNGQRLKKDFPRDRRFSKDLLAKYYCAWGDTPYFVKKGGEHVFRLFMEEIESNEKPTIELNRSFYEHLIAKIILFRSLEKIYGQGKNAIGQLRSAAVPYSMAVIHDYYDVHQREMVLDSIWKGESFSEEISDYFKELLNLINQLIKSYSVSDDYAEYSKNEQLWIAIKNSHELSLFLASNYSIRILSRLSLKK